MKYSLDLARPQANTTVIQIRATIGGRRIKMGMGVTIDPIHWDAKRCTIQNDQDAQDDLNAFVSAFVRAVGDMVEAGEAVTGQAIKNRLNRTLEGKPHVAAKWSTPFGVGLMASSFART